MPVLAGAESFAADGSPVGVLLAHGFTSTPQSLRALATSLADRGWSVRLPLLPGHGTNWQDLDATTWRMWSGELERAHAQLVARCRVVVVFGLSMGGALATRLAARHPGTVSGLALLNPAFRVDDPRLLALPVVRRLVRSVPGIGNDVCRPDGEPELCYDRTPLAALASQRRLWRLARADLSRVTCPVLLLRSAVDHVVPASSSRLVLDRVGHADVREVVLRRSYHVATLDHDAPLVESEVATFVERIAADARTGGDS